MRTLLLVLDSVGCGHAPDAVQYGDFGTNTLGHILGAKPEIRIPHLEGLGLREILRLSEGKEVSHAPALASIGCMQEASAGKDTTTGHWELAGVILKKPFPVFPSFPSALVSELESEVGVQFLGNLATSGTEVLERLGEEHCRTGNPILYTSADSVLQIAAHEEVVPLERLYAICKIARKICDPWHIGRVIARPFLGAPGAFHRTAGRHDFSLAPPPTILNALEAAGETVTGVGKISDIFAGSGVTSSFSTGSNQEGMERIGELWDQETPGLIFANLVDFDMLFGHRRNVDGYARALQEFDSWLGGFLPKIREQDWVVITADHGNDPTASGTDHTREAVPLWVLDDKSSSVLGRRLTFADVAATLAKRFDLPSPWPCGQVF